MVEKRKDSSITMIVLIIGGILAFSLFVSPPNVKAPTGKVFENSLPELVVSAIRSGQFVVVTITNRGKGPALPTTAAGFTSVGGIAGFYPQYQAVPTLQPGGVFIFGLTTPSSTMLSTAIYADFIVNPNGPTFYTPLIGGAVQESIETNNVIMV